MITGNSIEVEVMITWDGHSIPATLTVANSLKGKALVINWQSDISRRPELLCKVDIEQSDLGALTELLK